ncbi:MAG: hypothetical protein Q7R64_01655, partial [bacterium]|nr:hypothetical protein [bacterium]
ITAAVGDFGTAKVENGLEMKDSATGATYCVRITNGEWNKQSGSCGTGADVASSTPATGTNSTGVTSTSASDTTPPVLVVNGNNPANVEVGVSYADLGASVTDNVSSNLGVYAIVNGVDVGAASNISISTASSTTHTIEYYSTDGAGNRGSVQRIVNIGTATPSADVAVEPSASETATSTPATSEPEPEVVTEPPVDESQSDTSTPAPEAPETTPETPEQI